MFAQIQSVEQYWEALAKAGHAFVGLIQRTDILILIRGAVALVSLGTFRVVSVIADDRSILVLGLVPIIVFNFMLHGEPGSAGR